MFLSKKVNLAGFILKCAGWSVDVTVPDYPKAIICVAPHTTNWDFVLGKLAYASIHRRAGYLMKESWFFWPLGYFFKALGGIPVPRGDKRGGRSLVETITDMMKTSARMVIAITPEGTRSRTTEWHTGFLRIAMDANVPILLGAFDFKDKIIRVTDEFVPTGDIEADMRAVKDFYKPFHGKYPDKFTTD